MKTFFDIIAWIMAGIMIFGLYTVIHERITNGPPCHQVAEHRYVC